MRIMVFFDLPTIEPEDKKAYSKLRQELLKNGFDMLQYSIYVRICPNRDSVDKYIRVVQKMSPQKGSIRALVLTEKQYSDMLIITGDKIQSEDITKDRRFLYF